jgi:hypothetical protein
MPFQYIFCSLSFCRPRRPTFFLAVKPTVHIRCSALTLKRKEHNNAHGRRKYNHPPGGNGKWDIIHATRPAGLLYMISYKVWLLVLIVNVCGVVLSLYRVIHRHIHWRITCSSVKPALQTYMYSHSRCINTRSQHYFVCGRCGSWWSEQRWRSGVTGVLTTVTPLHIRTGWTTWAVHSRATNRWRPPPHVRITLRDAKGCISVGDMDTSSVGTTHIRHCC